MLASAVFAFETTLQPFGLLPLLGSCATAYLVSSLLMRNSIMTEKISRRGIRTPEEYLADPLDQILVREIASQAVISLKPQQSIAQIKQWLTLQDDNSSHQGYPVIDDLGTLVGMVTRRDITGPKAQDNLTLADVMSQPPKFVYDDSTVRQASDHMVNHNIGRLPVVSRAMPHQLIGIITRSDILSGYRRRMQETSVDEPSLRLFGMRLKRSSGRAGKANDAS